jgi:hypothetical protein
MGTGFSLDPNEYRAAADVIEGYGSDQADHGTALAAGTSTPLSSSGTGIAGAISTIAQGTVQKIVTDVASTTQGFANDTAQGLRTQAAGAEQLETDLAGSANSMITSAGSSLLDGSAGTSGLTGVDAAISSPTSYASSAMSTTVDTPLTASTSPAENALETSDMSAPGVGGSGSSGVGAGTGAGAGAVEQEESQQSSAANPFQGMRGGASAGADAADARGQRPDYLKSKTELTEGTKDQVQAAVDQHKEACGITPILFGKNRLVCAKCGILEVGDVQSVSA